MKIIKTALYQKLSKKKEWDPNPWAVCEVSVGKDKNPAKYERCVKKVKKKERKKDMKPMWEGKVYTPQTEDEYVEKSQGDKFHRRGKPPRKKTTWEDVERKMQEPAYASEKDGVNLKKKD
jgi:hypothetical protein